MEEKLKSRLFELAAKMSDNKETSSEELALEPRTELENQKSSSEDSGKCIQEELKRVCSSQCLNGWQIMCLITISHTVNWFDSVFAQVYLVVFHQEIEMRALLIVLS